MQQSRMEEGDWNIEINNKYFGTKDAWGLMMMKYCIYLNNLIDLVGNTLRS